MSNNFYNILNNFNKVAQEPAKPAVQQPKAKTKLQESIDVIAEKYMGFKKVEKAAAAGGAKDPAAVAAAVGRKKYGKEKFQKAAAAGKKMGEAAEPFKNVDSRVDKPTIKGTDKKAKTGYYPNPKPPVKKLDKPIDEASCGDMEESALQAYLGKKKYGEQGMKALQKAGRDGASKEKMAKIRAQHDKMDEVAPPGAKAERMVKNIKKGYAKDGKLTPKEKSIAYATAWKAHNKGKVEEAIKAMFEAGYTREQIVEGWEEMMKSVERRHKEEKGTGKFDKKKTDKGTKYTRKYDPKTGETDDTENVTATKRGRGRPRKNAFESTSLIAKKMISETFRNLVEGRIEGGVWVDKPGNVPVPQNPEVARPDPKINQVKPAPKADIPKPAANMGSAAKAMMAPNKVDPKAKVIPSDPEGVKEDDMEEGNAFTGALAKAKADGVQPGEKMKVGGKEYPVKEDAEEDADLEESLNQMRRIAGLPVVETKDKKADKDYDGDGKIESGKDEYLGSKIAAAKKAGKLKEGEMCSKCDCDPCECDDDKEKVDECMSPFANAAQEMENNQGRMNINTSMDSDGHKTVTISADGDAASELMQMLKLAGMGGGQDTEEPAGVMVVANDDEEMEENLVPQPRPTKADELRGNSVDEEKDERYHASTTPDEKVLPVQSQTKGGDGDVAGQEKRMHKHGYKFSDNPMAMHENATLKLMREYESIKAKK